LKTRYGFAVGASIKTKWVLQLGEAAERAAAAEAAQAEAAVRPTHPLGRRCRGSGPNENEALIGLQGGWEAVVLPAWDGSETALAGSKSGFGRVSAM
jgi:hypothetical protein